jgi:hypothetical protein
MRKEGLRSIRIKVQVSTINKRKAKVEEEINGYLCKGGESYNVSTSFGRIWWRR